MLVGGTAVVVLTLRLGVRTLPIRLFRGKDLEDVYAPSAMRCFQDDLGINADLTADAV